MLQLIRYSNSMIVKPWCGGLSSVLYYNRKTRDVRGGMSITRHPLYSLEKTEHGQLGLTLPGLHTRIVKYLQRSYIAFTEVDRRPPLAVADWDRMLPLREHQDLVLAAISSQHIGLIKGPTGFGKTHMLVQCARVYPDIPILITTPTSSVAKEIYTRMVEMAGGTACLCDATHRFNPNAHVCVCVTGSLHKIPGEWPRILFFDECHGAAADTAASRLMAFQNCRMYGLSGTPKGRADGADRLTEALFGPVIVNVPYATAQATGSVSPIRVKFFHIRGERIDADSDSDREWCGYWSNTARNKLAAEKIHEHFTDDEQVLVMVNTVEHALYLRPFLPGWLVVHSGVTKEKWLAFRARGLCSLYNNEELVQAKQRFDSDERRVTSNFAEYQRWLFLSGELESSAYEAFNNIDPERIKVAFKAGEILRAIVTTMWKQGVDFPLLRGFVPLSGTSSPILTIQGGGRLSRLSNGKEYGLLLDFVDDFGETFLTRSEKRERHYRSQGWEIEHVTE